MLCRYSGKLVYDEGESAANIIIVFFAVVIGAMAIGQGAPNFTTISIGRGAAFYIFKVFIIINLSVCRTTFSIPV
jgi:hypothetical protein